MSTRGTFSKVALVALIAILPVAIIATWLARGVYDEIFLLDGHVLVVNATEEPRQIQLVFPSGEQMDLEIVNGGSASATVESTGEGSVEVIIDGGVRKERVGYVTAMNSLIIITVSDERVVFSHVSP